VQPNPDSASPATTPAAAVPQPSEGTGSGIPPGIRRSLEAFRRDLPQLLADHKLYGRWVAYHGDERIGIARSASSLYQECARRGLKQEEFTVSWIVPEIPEDHDSTPLYPA
jgi:hypothetical protein